MSNKLIGFLLLFINSFFNAELALNAGALLAAIVIVSPVLGFLPVLSLRVRTSKLPKPFKETLSPLAKASVTTSTKAVTTLSTSVLLIQCLKQ